MALHAETPNIYPRSPWLVFPNASPPVALCAIQMDIKGAIDPQRRKVGGIYGDCALLRHVKLEYLFKHSISCPGILDKCRSRHDIKVKRNVTVRTD
jgi:hypothetical protein